MSKRNVLNPVRIYTNRVPGCICAACGAAILLGEQKTWTRTGRKANYHMPCAERLGVLVQRNGQWYMPNGDQPPVIEEQPHPPAPEHPFPLAIEEEPEDREDDVDVDVPEVSPAPPPAPMPDWMQGMAQAILPYIEQRINAKLDKAEVAAIVDKAVEKAKFPRVTVIEVRDPKTGETRNVGAQHKNFPRLLQAVQARTYSGKRNMVMLVGPTGSGKTTAAEGVAKALNVSYFHFGAMDNEYKMLGFVDAQGRIVSTEFKRWWNEGGLALFDEMDSWFPNATLALNSLSNGYITFPDGKQAGSPDRYLIAACNTWGLGGDNDYVGRFKLDAAFLNRWNVQMPWDYDEEFERSIFGNHPWVRRVQELRGRCRAKGIKAIMSPRASDSGPGLLDAGWSMAEVEEVTLKQAMKQSDWDSICLPRCA